MTKTLPLLLLLCSCGPTIVMERPIAYPSSCPAGDLGCERNLNAQTLAYIGHREAATALMCEVEEIKKVLEECGSGSSP